jgi:integrase
MVERKATSKSIIDGELLVVLRERSTVYQCHYKIDGKWQRTSTKQRDIKKAIEVAKDIYKEAHWKKKNQVAPITRYFRDVAKTVIKKLQDALDSGEGKAVYKDYITALNRYLIPILGKYYVDSIDYKAFAYFEERRKKKMKGKDATKSTQLTHNAALNKVFDEAVYRGYMVESNRLALKAKGKASERRVEFSVEEVKALRSNFDAWIDKGRADTKELRALLKDYVEVLLDTGARAGKELLDLKWAHIEIKDDPQVVHTGVITAPEAGDDTGSEVVQLKRNRTAYIKILTGKTSKKNGALVGRTAIGNLYTVQALERIAQRNYGMTLQEVINKHPQDSVYRYKEYQSKRNNKINTPVKLLPPTDLVKLFRQYLEEHNLYTDPVTGKGRPPYCLRHTYATIKLLHDNIPPSILVKQMGTSLGMLEKHYDHINTIKAAHQLRDDESRQLIQAGGKVNEKYEYREVKRSKNKKVS